MDEIIKYNSASGDTIKLHLPLDSAILFSLMLCYKTYNFQVRRITFFL